MSGFDEWWKEQPGEQRANASYSYNALKALSQSAYAAGLERAAEIASMTMCDDPSGEFDIEWDNACDQVAAAIRAEKEGK